MFYSKLFGRIGVIICVMLFVVASVSAQTYTPGLNLTTSAGAIDSKTQVWRDDTGIMYFLDNDNTTKTLSNLVTAGVTDHGDLSGKADDDHDTGANAYQTATRHTSSHVAAYNDALAITADANSNVTVGTHAQDVDIHYLRSAQAIVVAKSGGEYSSIQTALDNISDASASKPYAIYIAPGIYTEGAPIELTKSYISLVGLQAAGVKITEAQNSGIVITHESTGVGDDLMTLDIKSSGSEHLAGIIIANITIRNTQTTGYGAMQAAVTIGRDDAYGRTHEILFKNCNLYGEINTVYIETGNPVFKDCYIEGENQIVNIQDDASFEETYFYCHSDDYTKNNLLIGKSGDVEIKAHFMGCTFDTKENSQYVGVGEWSASSAISYFMSCRIMPPAWKASWEDNSHEGLIYLFDTNAITWVDGYTYALRQYSINSINLVAENGHVITYDADVSINFGSGEYLGDLYKLRAGVGYDGIPCYMPLEADYDQTDFAFRRDVVARAGDPVRASTGALFEIEHECDTDSSTNTAVLLRMKNTQGSGGFDYGAVGNAIEYYLDDVLKFVVDKDGDMRTSGSVSSTSDNLIIVDVNGGGDYTTIQAAINSISDSGASKPYVVYIMPGIYEPASTIILNKSYVSLIGIQPNGAALTEAQNSGVIITYESSGVGDDLMTLWIKGATVTTDLLGVTLANLTIINTQSQGVGAAQEALNIGGGDTYPRAHEVLVKNCSLYGEQDTVFVNTGNPVFQNCYIEGDLDIVSVADDSLFMDCFVYSHTNGKLLWIGRSGDVAFTASFINCTFDKLSSGSWYVGIFSHSNTTVNFYGCTLFPNAANGTNWDWNGETGTLNIFGTNGTDWGAATFIQYDELKAAHDGTFGGTVDALSLTIGANVLTTTEWAFLDGQDQAVKTTDSPFFDALDIGINIGATSGNHYVALETASSGGPTVRLFKRRSNAPVDDDSAGSVLFAAENSAGEDTYVAGIEPLITDVTDGTEDGAIVFKTMAAGATRAERMRIAPGGGLDFANYVGGKPAAAVAYRGQMVLEEGASGNVDTLYICLKGTDDNYDWIQIAVGETP